MKRIMKSTILILFFSSSVVFASSLMSSYTSDFTSALRSCSNYQKESVVGGMNMKNEILGANGGICKVRFTAGNTVTNCNYPKFKLNEIANTFNAMHNATSYSFTSGSNSYNYVIDGRSYPDPMIGCNIQ